MPRPKRKVHVKTCKFCGTELSHYGDYCDHYCRADYEENKGDHDYHAMRDRELNNF